MGNNARKYIISYMRKLLYSSEIIVSKGVCMKAQIQTLARALATRVIGILNMAVKLEKVFRLFLYFNF